MTEIEQLEKNIQEIEQQVLRAKEDFAVALKEREDALVDMRKKLEEMKHAEALEKQHKQEELRKEIEEIEEEKHRLIEREAEILAVLEEKTTDKDSPTERAPSQAKRKEEHHDGREMSHEDKHSAYVPGPLRESGKGHPSSAADSSLRDMIFATKSAPIASSHMGGTPIGSAQESSHKIKPETQLQPPDHAASIFNARKWEPTRMSSFNDQPVDTTFSNKETIL